MQLLDLKVPVGWGERGRVRKVMHYSENLSIKCQDQNITFASKLFSRGSIEQDRLLTNAKMFYFWGISVLNFSAKSAKK